MSTISQIIQGEKNVKNILSKSDCTYEKLLAEEMVVGELRNKNEKLTQFLEKNSIRPLVQFVIEEPPDPSDKLRAYKLPFIACEMLCSEVAVILDSFFCKEVPIEHLNHSMQSSMAGTNRFSMSGENSAEEKNSDIGQDEVEDAADFSEEFEEKLTKERSRFESSLSYDEDCAENDSYEIEEDIEVDEEQQEEEEERVENIKQISEAYGLANSKRLEEKRSYSRESPRQERCSYSPRLRKINSVELKEATSLTAYLFSFLEENSLNLMLAGYFSRVIAFLLQQLDKEMLHYFYTHDRIIDNFFRHLNVRAIAEILIKFLAFKAFAVQSDETYVEEREYILERLVSELNRTETDSETYSNAALILCEVLRFESTIVNGERLFLALLDRKNLRRILQNVIYVSGGDDELSKYRTLANTDVAVAVTVALERVTEDELFDSVNRMRLAFAEEVGHILEALVTLVKRPRTKELRTAFRETIEPFGEENLRRLELVYEVLRLDDALTRRKLLEINFFEEIFALFTRYEWNNLLHTQVEKLLAAAFEVADLAEYLFGDQKIVHFFLSCVIETDSVQVRAPVRLRKGYLGHLTRLATTTFLFLLDIRGKRFESVLFSPEWLKFDEIFLERANENNLKNLGNESPHKMSQLLSKSQELRNKAPLIDEPEMVQDDPEKMENSPSKMLRKLSKTLEIEESSLGEKDRALLNKISKKLFSPQQEGNSPGESSAAGGTADSQLTNTVVVEAKENELEDKVPNFKKEKVDESFDENKEEIAISQQPSPHPPPTPPEPQEVSITSQYLLNWIAWKDFKVAKKLNSFGDFDELFPQAAELTQSKDGKDALEGVSSKNFNAGSELEEDYLASSSEVVEDAEISQSLEEDNCEEVKNFTVVKGLEKINNNSECINASLSSSSSLSSSTSSQLLTTERESKQSLRFEHNEIEEEIIETEKEDDNEEEDDELEHEQQLIEEKSNPAIVKINERVVTNFSESSSSSADSPHKFYFSTEEVVEEDLQQSGEH